MTLSYRHSVSKLIANKNVIMWMYYMSKAHILNNEWFSIALVFGCR